MRRFDWPRTPGQAPPTCGQAGGHRKRERIRRCTLDFPSGNRGCIGCKALFAPIAGPPLEIEPPAGTEIRQIVADKADFPREIRCASGSPPVSSPHSGRVSATAAGSRPQFAAPPLRRRSNAGKSGLPSIQGRSSIGSSSLQRPRRRFSPRPTALHPLRADDQDQRQQSRHDRAQSAEARRPAQEDRVERHPPQRDDPEESRVGPLRLRERQETFDRNRIEQSRRRSSAWIMDPRAAAVEARGAPPNSRPRVPRHGGILFRCW